MRIFKVNLRNLSFEVPATWKVVAAIADKVEDPLVIIRELTLREVYEKTGVPFEPKFEITVRTLVELYSAVAEASEVEIEVADIGDAIVEFGAVSAMAQAIKLLEFLTTTPKSVTDKPNAPKKKKGGDTGKK